MLQEGSVTHLRKLLKGIICSWGEKELAWRGTGEAAYVPPYVWEYLRCSRGGFELGGERQGSHGEEMAKEIIDVCMGALICRSMISCFSIIFPCESCFCSRGGSEVWEEKQDPHREEMSQEETIDSCISMVFSVPISSSCESCLSHTT